MAKFDIYETIVNRILESLEAGIIPWRKPWVGMGGAVAYKTRKPYTLLNQMLIGEPGEYITFKQVQDLKGKVKKGAKSKMVVFYTPSTTQKKDKAGNLVYDNSGNPVMISFPVLKYYRVFNIKDCEGIETKFKPLNPEFQPEEEAERVRKTYIEREKITFVNDMGDRAFYRPSEDKIVVPKPELFESAEEYYSAAFHEIVHSTGHEKRLNRLSQEASFGNEEYSKEELVAEIGAAAICNKLGIETPDSFKNSTAYIQGWMKRIKEDKKLIVTAAGKADKAVKYIYDEKGE